MPDKRPYGVRLDDRDLSALRFAVGFVRGFEQGLEDRHPDDPNPVTGTREGEATSDVLAAIVARAERAKGGSLRAVYEKLRGTWNG